MAHLLHSVESLNDNFSIKFRIQKIFSLNVFLNTKDFAIDIVKEIYKKLLYK